MNASGWNRARPPNYEVNINLNYPASEEPFDPQYSRAKLTSLYSVLIDHVDYWGEGRIVTSSGVSGFPNCYNVNRQYQLVSNGPDMGRKIPNRVPVIDENHCDTSQYIDDDSVKLVTLMGAPITKCAQDIARMVYAQSGKVVVYGFSDNSPDIKLLKNELKRRGIFYCYAYPLPDYLKGLTLFDTHHTFLNSRDIKEELYYNITGGDYVKAVEIFKTLNEYSGVTQTAEVVNKILDQGIRNTTNLVYHLWNKGAQDIVINYFPRAFELIFGERIVKFTSKHYGLSLKLDSYLVGDKRYGWGDASDKSAHRLQWRIIPEFTNNNCVFKIWNMQFDMYLMLDATPDPYYGDRQVWGAKLTSEESFKWSLDPIQLNGQLLFLIVNSYYPQGWKLDSHTDNYGNRGLWGHNGNVATSPEYFGFTIEPM